MGLWHYLVPSAENPGDNLGMRLRKGVVGCLFFPVFFAVIGYAIRGYIVYSVPSPYAAAGACTGMGLVSAISFGWMRHTRSDRHIDVVLWGIAGFVTIAAYLCFPEFDGKTCVFACATMGILAQMPTLRVPAICLTSQCRMVDWAMDRIERALEQEPEKEYSQTSMQAARRWALTVLKAHKDEIESHPMRRKRSRRGKK